MMSKAKTAARSAVVEVARELRKLESRIASLETVLRELRDHEERRPEHVKSVATLFKIDAALVEKSDARPASPSESVGEDPLTANLRADVQTLAECDERKEPHVEEVTKSDVPSLRAHGDGRQDDGQAVPCASKLEGVQGSSGEASGMAGSGVGRPTLADHGLGDRDIKPEKCVHGVSMTQACMTCISRGDDPRGAGFRPSFADRPSEAEPVGDVVAAAEGLVSKWEVDGGRLKYGRSRLVDAIAARLWGLRPATLDDLRPTTATSEAKPSEVDGWDRVKYALDLDGLHGPEDVLEEVRDLARDNLNLRTELDKLRTAAEDPPRPTEANPKINSDDEYVRLSVAMAEAINYTLGKFGDGYEGCLSPIREAVEAFETFLVRDDGPSSESKGEPVGQLLVAAAHLADVIRSDERSDEEQEALCEAVDAWRASASPSARDPRMATEPAHTCVNTACGMPGVPIVPCPACAKLTPEQFSAMHYPQRTSEARCVHCSRVGAVRPLDVCGACGRSQEPCHTQRTTEAEGEPG